MKNRKERIDRGIKARTDDVYAVSGPKEISYILFPRMLLVLGLIISSILANEYWQEVIVSACLIGLLAVSWTLLTSVGLVSLGQALFVASGAYIAGILNYYLNWPIFITIPTGTFVGGAFCTFLLMPVLRLRGIYFSMVTLILPLTIGKVFEALHILGGNDGLSGLGRFTNSTVTCFLAVLATLGCFFGMRRLMATDYGLVFISIGDNDQAAMSGGIDVYSRKNQNVFLAAAVGAFVGAFITHWIGFVGTPAFALDYSILPIASAVVGGIGSQAGAMVGSFIVVPLAEILRTLGGIRMLFYSLALLVFIILLPEGIFKYLERKYHQFERRVKVE